MILLDTHIWVWWVGAAAALGPDEIDLLTANEASGLGVSIISVWEIAKKVELGKLQLDREVGAWISVALAYPGVQLLALTPEIAIESTRLPLPFHRDPADQILVATARILDIPVVTRDSKLIAYPHVRKAVV